MRNRLKTIDNELTWKVDIEPFEQSFNRFKLFDKINHENFTSSYKGVISGIMFYHHISARLSMLVKCVEHFISGLSLSFVPGLFSLLSFYFCKVKQHSEIEDYFAIKQAERKRNTCFFSHNIKPKPDRRSSSSEGGCMWKTQKARKGSLRSDAEKFGVGAGNIKETITYSRQSFNRNFSEHCLNFTCRL